MDWSHWIGSGVISYLYISCVVHVSCQICSSTESEALLKIKQENLLHGWSAFDFSSWNANSNCCKWNGVVCAVSTGSVIQLRFDIGNGTLSPSVCSLTNLEELDLRGRQKTEVTDRYIPSCIWNMTQLKTLDLSKTGLQLEDPRFPNSHTVPSPRLTKLDLSECGLTGMLPAWVGNFPQLQVLSLPFNDIDGLPESVGILSQLRELDLTLNRITGLPQSIGNLSQLSSLKVSNNFLSTFPPSIGRLSSLVLLDAQHNLISEVPMLENLTQLSTLYLNKNLLSSLSPSITSLSNLSTLVLSDNNISFIHPSFANMSGLSYLNLASNKLAVIEPSISSATFPHLQQIDLHHNNLTRIPKFIHSCPELNVLDLSENSIERFEAFPSASSLSRLDLSYNRLARFDLSAPSVFFSLPNISVLSLHHNNLLSVSLGNVSSLTELLVSNNLLQSIPLESILKQASLSKLTIAANRLQGTIPQEISSLPRVNNLDLSGNQLTGAIPPSFSNLTWLTYLSLSENNLTGSIPNMRSNISHSVGIIGFNFSHNSFTGVVPDIGCYRPLCDYETLWFFCVVTKVFDFSHNQLTGEALSPGARCPIVDSITEEVLLLSHNNIERFIFSNSSRVLLLRLDLSHNRLKGSIDSTLLTTLSGKSGQCLTRRPTALSEVSADLDLSNNQLTGPVPEIVTNCSRIGRLKLGNNLLRGNVPSSLGRVGRSLLSLSLRDNDLNGTIPPSLGNCSSLQILDLSGNRLTGALPRDLLPLNATLRVLSVARNNLSGPFPTWITAFQSLQVLDLSDNNFEGTIPDSVEFRHLLAFVDAHKLNEQQETLFSESISFAAKGDRFELVYLLSATTYFGIAHNHFHGPVPQKLGSLQGLVYLTLAGNAFNGSIPDSFGELQNLDSLDLSDNYLSGRIPVTFSQLHRIAYCNISFNQLSGPIPGGQMSTLDVYNYIHNAGLCGLPLPACSAPAFPGIAATVPDARSVFDDWISIPAAQFGFLVGFIIMTFSFLVTKRLRFASVVCAFQPPRTQPVYIYDQPYGVYLPPK